MEPDLGRVVSRLPAEVEFVAAMDDGATLRRSLGGSPIMLALGSMRRPAAVIDAWSQLAADLGMSEAEAFDLLLGQRVVFAASGLHSGAKESQWALLSELDPVTDRRLRADLGAVPRRFVNDQPVLELEHGSFLLATSAGRLRCTADGRFENVPASTIMLLAPAEDQQLFESMLPLLHCQTPQTTLSDTPGGSVAAKLASRDGVFLWRLPDAALSPDRFITGTVGFADGRWDVRAFAGPPRGWLPETDLDTLDAWSPRMLASLPGEPSLAVVGLRATVREAQTMLLPLLAPGLPETGLEQIETLLGERSLLAVWTPPEPSGERTSGSEVLIATEANDLDTLAEQNGAPPPQGAPHTVAPNAGVAQAPALLRPSDSGHVWTQRRQTLEDFAAPTVNWTYVTEKEEAGLRKGWFVVHIDSRAAAAPAPNTETQARASAIPPSRLLDSRRYLHVGHALPQRVSVWADAASRGGAGAPPSVVSTLLSRVHVIDWAVWLDSSGALLEADVSLRLAEPEAAAQ
jgi:hypothetical protein